MRILRVYITYSFSYNFLLLLLPTVLKTNNRKGFKRQQNTFYSVDIR